MNLRSHMLKASREKGRKTCLANHFHKPPGFYAISLKELHLRSTSTKLIQGILGLVIVNLVRVKAHENSKKYIISMYLSI